MSDYEGYVKYPGGEVLSTQCAEGRHGECPQGPDDEETGVPPGGPVLDGYYCECFCGHEHETLAGTDPRYPHVSVVLAAAANPVESCGRTLQVLADAGITDPALVAEFIRAARAGDYSSAENVIAAWVTITGRDA